MPDFLRPDISGVVFAMDAHDPPRVIFERYYIVARAMSDVSAFEAPPVKAAIDMFIEEGSLPVWLSFDGMKQMIYPNGDFAAAILDPDTASSPDVAAKARNWRTKYGLD